MKRNVKKLLCIALAALLVVGIAATAQAKSYTADATVYEVEAYEEGQTLWTWTEGGHWESDDDASPVFSGNFKSSTIAVDAYNGSTATLTLDNATINSCLHPIYDYYSSLDLIPYDGRINLILIGENTLIGTDGEGWDSLYISGYDVEQCAVSIQGTGSLTSIAGADVHAPGIFIEDAALSVDGGSVTAISPECYAVQLSGATLSVSEDYLHPASVTAIGGEGSFDFDDTSEIIIGKNNFVLDENGKDITAEVLANPELLRTLKYVIIATKDIAVFPSGKMDSDVHMMTAYKNTRFEQTGEPSAEAMKALSAGQNGDALYAGSFAFTDDIKDHGKFQVNIMLPQYAGQHVKLVTLDNGTAVAYDRWVGNDGLVWCHVDHLGDFAVFAA